MWRVVVKVLSQDDRLSSGGGNHRESSRLEAHVHEARDRVDERQRAAGFRRQKGDGCLGVREEGPLWVGHVAPVSSERDGVTPSSQRDRYSVA